MQLARDALDPVLVQARQALRAGNALLCFDIVAGAERRGLQAPELEYLSILALAHCGSTQPALDRYHRSVRAGADLDQDWLALEGRLFKDLAEQGGAAEGFLYQRAADSYLRAFEKTGGYFSAVNAATMYLLGGDEPRAQALAREVLQSTAEPSAEGELQRYNVCVSHAEAALLLGDLEACRNALRTADALARDNRTARARTVHQLRKICRKKRVDKTIPSLLTVPPQVFVCRDTEIDAGSTGEASQARLDRLRLPVFEVAGSAVFLSLRTPADLCVVEYFLTRRAHLTVVVPGTIDSLMRDWQARHGGSWAMRLARGLDQVGEVATTPGFLHGEAQWVQDYALAKALGLSRQNPEPIRSEWLALTLVPTAGDPDFALEAMDAGKVREIERRLRVPFCLLSESPRTAGTRERRLCAMLVLQLGGVAPLQEEHLPLVRTRLLAPLASELSRRGDKVLQCTPSGLGFHAVLADAATAVELAAVLQARVTEVLRDAGDEALKLLELRVVLHFGPLHCGDEPFAGAGAWFGLALDYTSARLGSVPAGSVFGTEAFAARLSVEGVDGFRLIYSGDVPDERKLESGRLFSLRCG